MGPKDERRYHGAGTPRLKPQRTPRAGQGHAELWAELARSGRLIGTHDIWLAAAALAHGLALATANVRAFGRVAGPELEDWTRR
jgi:tRNA(fMet)-specific endonuclease VapC